MAPTQIRSVPPLEGLLSIVIVEKSQTTVVCSEKEVAFILSGSSPAPSDKVVQPSETIEAQQVSGETEPSAEKMVTDSQDVFSFASVKGSIRFTKLSSIFFCIRLIFRFGSLTKERGPPS